jgi:integrase
MSDTTKGYIMKERFKITTFANPGGTTAYRVSGVRANGKFDRKNFTTEAAALTCKQNWEREIMNVAPLPAVTTKLSAAQIDEAEFCFSKLAQRADVQLTLTQVVDYALKNYQPSEKILTLNKGYPLFITDKKNSRKNGLAETTELKYKVRLKRLLDAHGEKSFNEITSAHIEPLFVRDGSGVVNRHSDRACFNAFFNWAVWRKYCQRNPVADTLKIKVNYSDREVQVLSLAQARKLVVKAHSIDDASLVPFVALALFCGVRIEEIRKLQLVGGSWDAINLKNKTVTIGAKIAKLRARRVVAMPDAAVVMLAAHELKRTPLYPAINGRKRREALETAVGFKLTKNVLRHTAVTYKLAHLLLDKKSGETWAESVAADWAGDSPAMIHKHYRGQIADVSDVDKFYAILPTDGEIVDLKPEDAKLEKVA